MPDPTVDLPGAGFEPALHVIGRGVEDRDMASVRSPTVRISLFCAGAVCAPSVPSRRIRRVPANPGTFSGPLGSNTPSTKF